MQNQLVTQERYLAVTINVAAQFN